MNWGRVIAAGCLLLFAGSCGPTVKQEVAACKIDAENLRARQESNAPQSSPVSDYVRTCMEAKGYNFTLLSAVCVTPDYQPNYFHEGCYQHNSWLKRKFQRSE